MFLGIMASEGSLSPMVEKLLLRSESEAEEETVVRDWADELPDEIPMEEDVEPLSGDQQVVVGSSSSNGDREPMVQAGECPRQASEDSLREPAGSCPEVSGAQHLSPTPMDSSKPGPSGTGISRLLESKDLRLKLMQKTTSKFPQTKLKSVVIPVRKATQKSSVSVQDRLKRTIVTPKPKENQRPLWEGRGTLFEGLAIVPVERSVDPPSYH